MKTSIKELKRIYKYQHSPKGIIVRIYCNQRFNSRKKGRPEPDYTLTELRSKFMGTKSYKNIYAKWVKSGYKKKLTPSLDRIDPMEPYTLENLQVMTWDENNNKGHNEMRITQGVKIIQKDMKNNIIKRFRSFADMEEITGFGYSNACSVCRGVRKHAYGFKWSYDK